MAKAIEFYIRDLFPAKAKSLPHDRGGVIEFPKDKAALASKISIPGRDEGPFAALGLDVSN
jgi:hypothetical protein